MSIEHKNEHKYENVLLYMRAAFICLAVQVTVLSATVHFLRRHVTSFGRLIIFLQTQETRCPLLNRTTAGNLFFCTERTETEAEKTAHYD